ncbi:MAG: amidohydrolase [Thermogemmata sp.]|uniref:Amidohydrolase n=1 Tax=Thermogemmata fonticola TaxID=2755323 RepID=A0A7V8VE74_9BACT|nr:amidohydrolase [Thermogemmata fonticola]MBA2226367.1 amidohydrolase [Thermogemmata fonticola]MCX8139241.1 amidohydrolase [Gemmataceae bacterium]
MDTLVADLLAGLEEIPLIDPHSHIDPLSPVARSLEDILGYHYYTELAHSAGMSQQVLQPQVPSRERVREILRFMSHYDNTAQYRWFVEIARTFLHFPGQRVTVNDADWLYETAERVFQQLHWEAEVRQRTRLEKIFLTNEFDDPLQGFDTTVYVPCLRTDTLVFQFHQPNTRQRLAACTGIEAEDAGRVRRAFLTLMERFVNRGAKACAISLPPQFVPAPLSDAELDNALRRADSAALAPALFWLLAECCRTFQLPFDLMIGVQRRVYRHGVFQGQDLFDQRTSLIQYQELFNAFPEVLFPISVLTSNQNQELVAYSWIFPNVIVNGHWWYSNTPPYIRKDLTERITAVPKNKLIGYYSDAYKLEFVLPKYRMYRQILAEVLAAEFVRPGLLSETEAVALGRQLLYDNVRTIFRL